jgi:hypothetical protein
MLCRRALIAAAALLALASSAWAQPPGDTAVTFGNRVSVASITAAMQAAGFQALVAPRPPAMPEVVLGVISTGLNGAKGTVLVSKCENSKADDVCVLTFLVPFTDDKNIVTDALLASINQKTVFAKVTRGIRPTDNKPMLNVMYNYVVKDLDDTKFIVPVMSNFAQDIGRVVAAYNAAVPPASPPAK